MSQQPKIETVEDKQEEVDEPGAPKLTKNQKKKLKDQAKKEAEKLKVLEKKEQGEVEQPVEEEKKDKKKKDGKKPNAAALLALKKLQKERLEQEDLERQKKQFEEKQRKIEQEQKEKQRIKQQQKDRRKKEKKELKDKMKKEGLYASKKDKKKIERDRMTKEQIEKMKNDEDSDDDSDSQNEGNQGKVPETKVEEKPAEAVAEKVVAEKVVAEEKPKKKYVKPKVQSLEEIYAEAMKKKAEEAEKAAQKLENVEDWEQLADNKQRKASEKVEETKTEVTVQQPVVPKPEKQKKDKKKDKKKEPEPEVKKKEQPELAILIDKKKYFQVDQNEKYRSPICCILGHVDTGKTSILDKIRRTSVQENEAGGITQQIGATFFPKDKLLGEISKCHDHYPIESNVQGLLIIDTPGHESFSNLRSRGSSLCDIAILVIDLMHGLQKQTLESIKMLSDKGTHFVIAMNKIDRSYEWVPKQDGSSYVSLKSQAQTTIQDYNNRLNQVKLQLNQEGFNIAMYWQNEDINEYVSIIPTSARTGEGLPDLMTVLVKQCMMIPSIEKRLRLNTKKFNCTVMEVKMIEGHGTTIDCILVDGELHKNDQIVLLGFNGPIVTKIKALLTPHPMKQMRIKDQYIYHDYIRAANGVKIDAPGIDEAVAGTPLFVANTEEDVDRAIEKCNYEYQSIKNKIKLSDMGVGVAASTLGSLEALLDYLAYSKVPVSYVSVGPVSKQDVMKAMKSMLSQNPEKRKKQFCCILVFDVKVLEDAKKYAEDNHIKIFWADIIYHLTDHFNKYVKQIREERKLKEGKDAVFPCVLKIVEIFRKSEPVVLGVDVEEGILRVGTPISVYNKQGSKIKVGVVESIESNHKKIKEARKASGSVAVAISGEKVNAGKDFLQTDRLCSLISRKSIDCLKEHFRDELTEPEWRLVIELKKYLNVT